jgi:hypothetical protein
MRQKRFSLTKETAPASEAHVELPDRRALRLVAITYGIPFVGFGLCDNAIMLLCSDYIESNFHHILGISTLGAAGLGNCVCLACSAASASCLVPTVCHACE